MNTILKVGLAAGSALVLIATAAFADVVCNSEGDCWHIKNSADYTPDFKLHVHPDGWKWAEADDKIHRWREHEGHGYWRNGIWVEQ
jgi:hypothetical protein